MRFHRRCGDRVTLLHDSRTAVRNFIEFNHGVLLSAEPLRPDQLFQVTIDKMVNVWNGSLEIGVTTLDPESMELPATATRLRNSAWIMSGNSIVIDGVTTVNSYGTDLDALIEGDNVGVMRSSLGELKFYINGRCLGVAATALPLNLYAVIDLYGQCVQVTISEPAMIQTPLQVPLMQLPLSLDTENSVEQLQDDTNNDNTTASSELELACVQESPSSKDGDDVRLEMTMDHVDESLASQDRLRFHPRCGTLVNLSNNNKTGERARPLDDYNNGVVMTHRPLYDGELFEIRIDRLVDKWSGSIEVGVTSHNPATIRFPSTMTNMESGTIMLSGCKVLINGQGTTTEYGNFNLDELREGDTVGMMRTSTGKLHFFINGVDQGVATHKVDLQVWGVIDLYGMTVKVSIVDPVLEDAGVQRVAMIENNMERQFACRYRPRIDEDSLLFHTLRDSDVIILNDGKTAHRPNAFEYFNNGVVMTNRTLKTNELFQVRLDLVIPKWAGSIEIGVTQHSSNEIIFPFKMSNAKSGTWAMTGEDVIRDGSIIIPQYVRNLNKLVEGDTVGVMRKEMGILHFFVNGVDQGMAAFNVPEHVFGVIDLYGRVAQATIADNYLPPPPYSPESPLSSESNATIYPELCFHRVHGRNVRLSRSRLTATRQAVYSEFNDAVLFSSRPLRECEMFELRIDKMVDCWIGSLEIGVTAIKPDELDCGVDSLSSLAGTATDLSWNTYILSGAAMMKDGECVRSGYPLDLDRLTVGSRVGMMWHSDRSLHYYLDGMDQGRAWYVPHLNIYAVADLYGQCTQVTILQNEERGSNYNVSHSDNSTLTNPRNYIASPQPYCFSEYCGENIWLSGDSRMAVRRGPDPTCALVFSAAYLALGELFEIKLVGCKSPCAGTLRVGLTDVNILNAHVNRSLPPSITCLPHFTSYVDGKYLMCSASGSKEHHVRKAVRPSFDWLRPGDRIGLKKESEGRVSIHFNSEQLEAAFDNVPDKVFVVAELYGRCTAVRAISKLTHAGASFAQPTYNAQTEVTPLLTTANTTEAIPTAISVMTTDAASDKTEARPYTFHPTHGANIRLCSSDTVAIRYKSYDYGIAVVSQPLYRGQMFNFRVDKIDPEWSGSVMIGAVASLPTADLPVNALQLEKECWVLDFELVNIDGVRSRSELGKVLESVQEQTVLGLRFSAVNSLELHMDGEFCSTIANIPAAYKRLYPLIDLYGQCTQVSVLLHTYTMTNSSSIDLPILTDAKDSDFYPIKSTSSHNTDCSEPDAISNEEKSSYEADEKTPTEPEDGNTEDTGAEHPKASTSEDRQRLSMSLLGHIHRRRMSETRNDIINRTIQRSKSNHSFPDELTNEAPPNVGMAHSLNGSVEPQQALFDVNQQPIVLRESDCGFNDVTDELLRDTNVRHNALYPELNGGESSIDSEEIMNALSAMESNNWPDLNEERSSSADNEVTNADESFGHQELEVAHFVNANFGYLKNLIYCEIEPDFRIDYAPEEWDAVVGSCEYLHSVLKYWKDLVPHFPANRRSILWGMIECYCTHCKPDAEPRMSGWVRVRRNQPPAAPGTERVFWNVDGSLLRWVLLSNANTLGRASNGRPLNLEAAPSTASNFSTLWFDEERKPLRACIAIEIDQDAEDEPQSDKMVALLLRLQSPDPPHVGEEVQVISSDDDDA